MNILGYTIDRGYPDFSIPKKKIINTINPHSYCVAKKDAEFREALRSSDSLIPDGTGIVWAVRGLKGERIKRIAGANMHQHILEEAHRNEMKVFYLGSCEETLSKIEQRIKQEYPNIKCASYSPPFKTEFSASDTKKMIDAVNAFQPYILFVGMTAPKQEKWVHQNKDHLDSKIICSIGAVFDFYAGTVKRAPVWMQNASLEWLHRLLSNPKRLWKRNFVSTPQFLWDVLKAKVLSNPIPK